MRKSQSSLNAAGIAIMRAVESERPADERICYDPFARRFVPTWLYYLMRFFIRRGPGVNGFLAARDRYIDDVLQNSLSEGLQQLVILGAGYDSRAYRFMTGEGLTFGIPADKIETFLKERGFRHAKDVDVDADALKAAYFTGKNASRAVAGMGL